MEFDRDNKSLYAALTRAQQPKYAAVGRVGALHAGFHTVNDQTLVRGPAIEPLDFRQNGVTLIPCQQQMMTMRRMHQNCMRGNA